MPTTQANGLDIFYEDSGPQDGPVILLVMGLASQLTAWPPEFVEQLNGAGYRTVRFDNRDIGLSEKLHGRKAPNLPVHVILARFGFRGLAPYRLTNMAQDAVGLLDALDLDQVHVVGASMGGMISQILAANNSERVRSLTAIMTSTNRRNLPGPRADVSRQLLRPGSPVKTPEEAVERAIKMWNLISTPDSGRTPDQLRERVIKAVRRSHYPPGPRRQTAAIVDTGDLRRWTRRITSPTLVIHGDADPLVSVAGGKDVARNIRGSRLELISGMGHDLPPKHISHICKMIVEHVRAADGKESPQRSASSAST